MYLGHPSHVRHHHRYYKALESRGVSDSRDFILDTIAPLELGTLTKSDLYNSCVKPTLVPHI